VQSANTDSFVCAFFTSCLIINKALIIKTIYHFVWPNSEFGA
jgi:hypothetical protein